MPVGSATLNYGAAPGASAVTVTVTGQTGILSGSKVEAWISGTDSTATHNGYEHAVAAIKVSPLNIVAGVGFDIIASGELRLTGTFVVNWVWYNP